MEGGEFCRGKKKDSKVSSFKLTEEEVRLIMEEMHLIRDLAVIIPESTGELDFAA